MHQIGPFFSDHPHRVCITGAAGVLGNDLFHYFNDDPHYHPIAVARRSAAGLDTPHPQLCSTQTLFEGDWLSSAGQGATIIHCAGLSDPRARYESIADLTRREVLPHLDMVEALLARGWCGRMIYFSSGGTVYGEARYLPIPETHPTDPQSFYGLQKMHVEKGLAHLAQTRGFELVVLRVSNPYGMRLIKKNQGVIPILADRILREESFQIYGDGTAERDYLEISDLCTAVRRAAEVPLGSNPVLTLNIGSGEGVSLNRLIALLTGMIGRPLDATYVPTAQDVQSNVLCCRRAQQILGWAPKTDLDSGLQKLVSRMQSARGRGTAASSDGSLDRTPAMTRVKADI